MMILILIYLLGYILGYFLTKHYITANSRLPWTIEDRNKGLIYSLGSWFLVITVLICLYIEKD